MFLLVTHIKYLKGSHDEAAGRKITERLSENEFDVGIGGGVGAERDWRSICRVEIQQ